MLSIDLSGFLKFKFRFSVQMIILLPEENYHFCPSGWVVMTSSLPCCSCFFKVLQVKRGMRITKQNDSDIKLSVFSMTDAYIHIVFATLLSPFAFSHTLCMSAAYYYDYG